MQPKDVPLGQKMLLTDTSHIKATFERTSQQRGILEQFEPTTGKLVFRGDYAVDLSSINILYADPSFWTFKRDGVQIYPPLDFQYSQINVDPQSKTINFTTK